MTSEPVVVGVDGSTAALRAVRWAAERANRDNRPLRIVHAYDLPLGFPTGVTEEESILNGLRLQGRRWLAAAQDVANEVIPASRVEVALAARAPTTGLLHESERAALLVLGNRGNNAFTGLLVGSTSLALAGIAHCPVVLVRNGVDGNPRPSGPIVVGVDGTEARAPRWWRCTRGLSRCSRPRSPAPTRRWTGTGSARSPLWFSLSGWRAGRRNTRRYVSSVNWFMTGRPAPCAGAPRQHSWSSSAAAAEADSATSSSARRASTCCTMRRPPSR
jgi:nucleotide-binding universal stress UspA family protein